MAGMLAASLSSLSSGINATAALILKDAVELAYQFKTKTKIRDALATKIAKIIS